MARRCRRGSATCCSLNGLVDLASILPFWIALFVPADLRAILVLRMFRFLKLARYSVGVRSLLDAIYAERRPLFRLRHHLAGTTLLAASLMYLAERHAQPEKFGTIPLAMWWAVSTLGTTGYGDVVPITPLGRILNGFTVLAALVMIALPVGIVATAFSQQVRNRDFLVTWGMVARVPLFAGLDASDIADVIRLLSTQMVEEGTVIARRGDPSHSMYFIASGEVEIALADGPKRLGAGQFFGEVAVLRRSPRSATVTATERTHLLVLDAQDFRALLTRHAPLAERINKAGRSRQGQDLVEADGSVLPKDPEGSRAAEGDEKA